MRNHRTILFPYLAIVLALCLPSFASSANYYVSPSGNDSNNGSAASPWLTLQHAADTVVAGDVVTVQAGTYAGFALGWNFPQSGTAGAPITFQADPLAAQGSVIINAKNPYTTDGIDLEGSSYVTISSFAVINAGTITRAGIRAVSNGVVNAQGVVIENNACDNNGEWGIFTSHEDGLLVQNNVTSRSQQQHGIYISNASVNPVARGNTSWGNADGGIQLNGDLSQGGTGLITGALVENNVIHDNGTVGGGAINLDGVQNSIIRNNVLYNNHASGIALFKIDGAAGPSGNQILNNTIVMASNARWALRIDSSAGANTLRNNIVYDDNTAKGGIDFTNTTDIQDADSDYNIFNANAFAVTPDDESTFYTLAQWQALGHETHSFNAASSGLFVNTSSDFHLAAGSPAMDKGQTLAAVPADISGVTRPQGPAYDIGAYEYLASSPVVTLQPAGSAVTEGQTATFSVTAAGSLPLAYQWRKNGANIAGATSASYTTPALTASDIGDLYAVTVSNAQGSSASSAARLAVLRPASLAYLNIKPPSPLAPPSGVVVNVSNTAALVNAFNNLQSNTTIIIASGTYLLTSTLIISGVSNITVRGATENPDDTLLIGTGEGTGPSGASPCNVGAAVPFGIHAGNVAGSLTIANLAIKAILCSPIQLDPPIASPTIHNVHLIDAGEQFVKSNPISSGNGINNGIVEYSVMEFGAPPITNYTNGVDVHGGAGWTIRDNLFRNIVQAAGNSGPAGPSILMWNGSSNTVADGNNFIQCDRGISYGLIQQTGFHDHYGGVIRNTFFSRNADPSGDVAIAVFDSPNTTVANNTVIQGDYPNAIEYRFSTSVNEQLLYNLTNQAITARSGATGILTGNVTNAQSSWFVNAAAGDLHKASPNPSVTGQATLIAQAPDDYNGLARHSPTDVGASEYAASAVTAPTITQQPASQTVNASQTATLSITAAGTAPLSYQWQENGVNIPGATSASYTTPPATLADNGALFRCMISNSSGTAISNSAKLTVNASSPTYATEARIFPNPLRPAQGQTSMSFSGLPANARIRIFTLLGAEVGDFAANASGAASWNGTNQSGEKVASGVYFILVEGGGYRKIFKVVIQR